MLRMYIDHYNDSEVRMATDGLTTMMNAIPSDCNDGCDNCQYSDLCGDLARTMHWLSKMLEDRERRFHVREV